MERLMIVSNYESDDILLPSIWTGSFSFEGKYFHIQNSICFDLNFEQVSTEPLCHPFPYMNFRLQALRYERI